MRNSGTLFFPFSALDPDTAPASCGERGRVAYTITIQDLQTLASDPKGKIINKNIFQKECGESTRAGRASETGET